MSNLLNCIKTTPEYAAIAAFYGERRALRSKVPLINHIHEGIAIIEHFHRLVYELGEPSKVFNPHMAARAYCLHPLFQNDEELLAKGIEFASGKCANAHAVMLAMEYRARANAWLSDKVTSTEVPRNIGVPGPIELKKQLRLEGLPDCGPVREVRAMLVADKVQNRKDFVKHHLGKHARSEELELYFRTWLTGALGLSPHSIKALEDAAGIVHHG